MSSILLTTSQGLGDTAENCGAIPLRTPAQGRWRSRSLSSVLAALAMLAACVGGAAAQVVPLGPATQIDTSGTLDPQWARIASDGAGNYTVVWTHNFGEKVVARRFTATGQPLDSSERTVAAAGLFAYSDLDLAIDPAGRGTLAFIRSINGNSLWVQQLGTDGLPLGAAFSLTTAGERPENLDVATATDGRFAVAWHASDQPSGPGGTFVEIFDVAAFPLGGATLSPGGSVFDSGAEPAVILGPGDRLLAGWDRKTGGSLPDRQVRVTAIDLAASTSVEHLLELTQHDDQRKPLLAPLAGGGSVVVWNQIRRFVSGGPEWSRARAQLLDAAGDPVGPVRELGAYFATSLVALDDGGLVVVADDTPDANRREGILAQRFDAALAAVDTPFWIDPAIDRFDARATATGDGFVVTWVDNDEPAVFTRAYEVDPPTSAIEVTSPNGGETIVRESFHDVTWSAPTISGRVSIELSRDGGSTWEILKSHTVNDGLWSWRVQGAPTTAGQIRVSSIDDPSDSDTSDGLFTIPVPQVTLLGPNGGESWPMLTVQNITWSLTNIAGPARLEVSRDGGASWQLFAAQTLGGGVYGWSVQGPPSPEVRFRVSSYWDSTISDTGDGDFEIPVPQIAVLGPNGGESLPIGPFTSLTWSLTDLGGPVSLELSRDGGVTWELIDDETPNDGQMSWQVTGPATSQALLRVRSFDQPEVLDTSDAVFTIGTP